MLAVYLGEVGSELVEGCVWKHLEPDRSRLVISFLDDE